MKLLSIICEKSWWTSLVPTVWKRGNVTPFLKTKREKEGPRNYRLVSVTLVPGKIEPILESVLKYMENKEAIGDSQHSFTKYKSCLTNLEAFQKWGYSIGGCRKNDIHHLP